MFSYAVSGSNNQVLLEERSTGEIFFIVDGTPIDTGIYIPDENWHHWAVTWRSRDGQVVLYRDGEKVSEKTLKKGYQIQSGGSLILGQEQDSVGGDFDPSQTYKGQIAEVSIWDVALSANQILLNSSIRNVNDRFWRFLPFRGNTLQKLQDILGNDAAIDAYNNNPFDPHAIARLRIGAYEKAIVMKYIDNLLDWGDLLFAQDNRESKRTIYCLLGASRRSAL